MAKSHPSSPKPRLGRGLSSLIGNLTEKADEDKQYVPEDSSAISLGRTPIDIASAVHERELPGHIEVHIDQIGPNPYQPRRQFKEEDLSELADSISKQGILQPLIISPAEDPAAAFPYTLIAGERRLRAARKCGLSSVPCVIRKASRRDMLEWALIENIQRTDLNPVERAEAYRDYMDRFSLTQVEAAERLGQPRTTIANYLRILDLCDVVRKILLDGDLSFGHAKVLAGLVGSPARQTELAKRVVSGSLSVRQLEGLVATQLAGDAAVPRTVRRRVKAPYILDLEERLTQAVGTRVTIRPGRGKNSGRLLIDYYSLEDFDRIAAALGLKSEN